MFKFTFLVTLIFSLQAGAAELSRHSAFVDNANLYVTVLGAVCNSHRIKVRVSDECVVGSKTCKAELLLASTRMACEPGVKAHTTVIKRSSLGLPKSLKRLVIVSGQRSLAQSYEVVMSKTRKLGFIVLKNQLYISSRACNFLTPEITVEDYCRSDRSGSGNSDFCHASLIMEVGGAPLPCHEANKELVVSKVNLRHSKVDKRTKWLMLSNESQEYKLQLK